MARVDGQFLLLRWRMFEAMRCECTTVWRRNQQNSKLWYLQPMPDAFTRKYSEFAACFEKDTPCTPPLARLWSLLSFITLAFISILFPLLCIHELAGNTPTGQFQHSKHVFFLWSLFLTQVSRKSWSIRNCSLTMIIRSLFQSLRSPPSFSWSVWQYI